ncbi:uncharacterized protein [Paramisgurnus dabryanus]|uniref:uncharacterized protein isoform X12 n=1 Tax=Paramisgurnus dabryanus TaxID=90735 RepID=UPI0031F37AC8
MSAACYRERSPAYACKENNRGPQMTTLHMIKPTKACWSKPLTRSQRKLVTQALSGSPNLSLEGRSTAEFSSYPDQTHLSKLIKVFMITRKSQVW